MTTSQLDARDLSDLTHALQVRADHFQSLLDDLSASHFPNEKLAAYYHNEVERANELLSKLISLRTDAYKL